MEELDKVQVLELLYKQLKRTETTTVDSDGNKKTVVKEETGDGQVKEYLLGEDGKKEKYKEIKKD